MQTEFDIETAGSIDAEIYSVIQALFPSWRAALPVATLDPEATDGNPSNDPAASITNLLEVLGAVPHPGNLHLRTMLNHVEDDAGRLQQAFDDIEAIFADPNVRKGEEWEAGLNGFRARVTGIGNADVTNPVAPSLAAQAAEVEALKAWIEGGWIEPSRQPDVIAIIESQMDPLIELYQEVTDAVPPFIAEHFGEGGISIAPPAVNKPEGLMNFVASAYEETLAPIRETVAQNGTLDSLADLLELAIGKLEALGGSPGRDTLLEEPAPLLHHLIDLSYRFVAVSDAPALRLSCQLLQERIADVRGLSADDPALVARTTELDRLQRETLSLFMNRLDAWITSFSTKRLGELRAKTPRGLTIGGYGWLLDLKPSLDSVSDGYIHAPSMNHAATAAVLRSGWEGYGTSNGTAPLAVDLTSDRVRGAEWILDGVRNGQDLAEILGARFERFLHEDALPLDSYIDDIRRVVNAARGLPRPESQIADGVLIARAFSANRTTEEDAIRANLLSATTPTGNANAQQRNNAQVRTLFHRLAADLDAVADVTLAQSVHALVQGKEAQTASVLNMLGDQEGAIPPIDLPRTPREAQLITHRVLAFCNPTTTADKTVSPLCMAEPRISAWLADRLPLLSDVSLQVRGPAKGGRTRLLATISLADLGLEPAELFTLAGRGVRQEATPLGRILAAYAKLHLDEKHDRETLVLRFDLGSKGRLSVNEFGVLAGATRDALSRARALMPDDIAGPGTEPRAKANDDEISERIKALSDYLALTAKELALSQEMRAPIELFRLAARLAAINFPSALSLAEDLSNEDCKANLAAALTEREGKIITSELPKRERLGFAIGKAMPICPVLTLLADDDLWTSVQNSRLQNDSALHGADWWRQACKVAEGAAALADFLDLSRATRPAQNEKTGVVQLPHHGESWAAISRPSQDTRDRLCLYAASGFDRLDPETGICGLVADSWVESIPREDHQTGIAWHFDSPSARAPQVILLSMIDEGTSSGPGEQIFDQLLNTLELTKTRVVGADRVADLGQFFPATFLPDGIAISEPGA